MQTQNRFLNGYVINKGQSLSSIRYFFVSILCFVCSILCVLEKGDPYCRNTSPCLRKLSYLSAQLYGFKNSRNRLKELKVGSNLRGSGLSCSSKVELGIAIGIRGDPTRTLWTEVMLHNHHTRPLLVRYYYTRVTVIANILTLVY